MADVVMSLLGRESFSTATDLDSHFVNLLDIVPPECYFEAETLATLKASCSPCENVRHVISAAKFSELSTISQCSLALEQSQNKQKPVSGLRAKLQNRIQEMKSKRTSKKEGNEEKKQTKKKVSLFNNS